MSCTAPSTAAYDLIGGEPGINAFVSRLYDIMARKPEARNHLEVASPGYGCSEGAAGCIPERLAGRPYYLSADLRAANDAPAAYGISYWTKGA